MKVGMLETSPPDLFLHECRNGYDSNGDDHQTNDDIAQHFLCFFFFAFVESCLSLSFDIILSHMYVFLRLNFFLFVFRTGEFHQVSLDESVNLTVHHTVYIGGLEVGTMILHTAVIEHVATDL